MGKKFTTEDFILKSQELYRDKYSYDEVEYSTNHDKVKIKCNNCQTKFEQQPRLHLSGIECKKCSHKYDKKTQEQFLQECANVHGDKYNYEHAIYNGLKKEIKIKCYLHGFYKQLAKIHLRGSGCPNCMHMNKNTEDFINESRVLHGDRYDYSKVIFKGLRKKVKIKCNNCQRQFQQTPKLHLAGCGCGCGKSSKGELFLKKWLDDNNIQYIQQKRFKDCRNTYPLPFDFYIKQSKVLLEYNGRQHYEQIDYFGGEPAFAQRQINDNIKRLFAKSNDFNLIEIPYTLSDEEIVSLLDFHLKK